MATDPRPNNGYPADWKNINVWLSPALRRRLKRAVAESDENASILVRRAIEAELDRIESASETAIGDDNVRAR
jgi:hypothetical protein